MSQQAQLDPTAIFQQLASLERYLNDLQRLVESVGNTLVDTRVAKQALQKMKEYEQKELLVSTDRTGSVLLKTILKNEDPIVHLGLNVYVQMPVDKAVELLEKREKAIESQLESLQKELADKAREYERLQQLVAVLSQQAQQAQMPPQQGAKKMG